MREILFRAKEIEKGKWVYGAYFAHQKVNLCIITEQDEVKKNTQHLIVQDKIACDWNFENGIQVVDVNPETIGQYTGLEDKNGTKIFDGDIVKYTRTNMYAPTASFHNQDLISLHRIYWNDEKHCFYEEHYKLPDKECIGGGCLNFNDERADENIIEVIGNIYDNPELLEGV